MVTETDYAVRMLFKDVYWVFNCNFCYLFNSTLSLCYSCT